MSEWAYKKCEKCGNSVHINHTCKEWNTKEDCDGDPWQEIIKRKKEIKKLKEQKSKLKSDLIKIDMVLDNLKNII